MKFDAEKFYGKSSSNCSFVENQKNITDAARITTVIFAPISHVHKPTHHPEVLTTLNCFERIFVFFSDAIFYYNTTLKLHSSLLSHKHCSFSSYCSTSARIKSSRSGFSHGGC